MKLILIVIMILFLSCENKEKLASPDDAIDTVGIDTSLFPPHVPTMPNFSDIELNIVGNKILVYPENARRNNIEGIVRINFWILNGKVISAIISESSGNAELDSSVIKYARLLSFTNIDSLLPLSLPFEFKLIH